VEVAETAGGVPLEGVSAVDLETIIYSEVLTDGSCERGGSCDVIFSSRPAVCRDTGSLRKREVKNE